MKTCLHARIIPLSSDGSPTLCVVFGCFAHPMVAIVGHLGKNRRRSNPKPCQHPDLDAEEGRGRRRPRPKAGWGMRYFRVAVIITTFYSLICDGHAACLTYTNRVYVTGTLTRQVFPGPPGYESIARGDTPEIYYVLKLDPAACVDQDPTDRELPAIKNVTDIQLVLTHEQYVQLEKMLGRRIRVSGTLFPAETGHHHTPVLMDKAEYGH